MFGHTTYEIMKSYWPTPDAIKNDPGMAEVVNNSPKIVFSKTLESVKEGPSGTIVKQLANLGLIDEYSLVVVPVILGAGKPLFKDVKKTNLKLLEARSFKNGVVLLNYQPIK
jgi:dihydrofolate reductase